MLAFKLLSAVCFAALVTCDTSDFDTTYSGHEFIFHDNTDLGLIIHRNNCYFLHIPDSKEYMAQYREELVSVIRGNDPRLVQPSSLGAVRDKYEDRLADFHCMDKNISEITLTRNCPPGWTGYSGSCYKFFGSHERHDSAMDLCRRLGSHMVEITSSGENSFVKQLLSDRSPAWIGLDDKDHEGRFVLPSTGREPPYHNWSPGQPDNWLLGQDCVTMEPWSGYWSDAGCVERHSCVCEK